jgi:bifunctional ADP-heptose synthase (sugar kinase/adenylyltransferase)
MVISVAWRQGPAAAERNHGGEPKEQCPSRASQDLEFTGDGETVVAVVAADLSADGSLSSAS